MVRETKTKTKTLVETSAPAQKGWRQIQQRHKAVYSVPEASNELFFFNTVNSALGRLVAGGTGKGGKLVNWWNDARRQHKERHYSLAMLLEGSGGFYANDNGFECPLRHGDFYLGIPGHRHRFAPGKDEVWSVLSVEFEGAVFDALKKEKVLSGDVPVWHLEYPEPWLLRFQGLLQRPRPTTTVEVARETAAFLSFLLEMLAVATPQKAAFTKSDWFSQACVILSSDVSRPLDLRAIATELGMGYENFRLHFRRHAGMPPGQYRDRQRCKAACEKLLETRKPCWEIALYLGFCDEQHFSKRFKKWTGLSPQAYRVQHTVLKHKNNDKQRIDA